MSRGEWIVENTWTCPYCKGNNRGRDTKCTTCGREKGKDVADHAASGDEPEVVDPELLRKANAGANVVCPFCDGQVRMVEGKCPNCSATRTSNSTLVGSGTTDAVGGRLFPTERARRLVAQLDRDKREREHATAPEPEQKPASSTPEDGAPPYRPLYSGSAPTATGTLIGAYWFFVRRFFSRGPFRYLAIALAMVATLATAAVGAVAGFARRFWPQILGTAGFGGIAWFFIWLFVPHAVNVTVVSATWDWRADLRQKTLEHGSDWQGDVPSSAFDESCDQRQRGTRDCNRHACGTESESYSCGSYSCNCSPSCTSNENGFSTCRDICSTCTKTCQREVTRYCYDQCPVYDLWCSYSYYDWPVIQTMSTHGACADERPRWPPLEPNGPDQRVDHTESYHVVFGHEANRWHTSPDDIGSCRKYVPDAEWVIKVNHAGQVWPQHPRS